MVGADVTDNAASSPGPLVRAFLAILMLASDPDAGGCRGGAELGNELHFREAW
jgi:hypothetical protein